MLAQVLARGLFVSKTVVSMGMRPTKKELEQSFFEANSMVRMLHISERSCFFMSVLLILKIVLLL